MQFIGRAASLLLTVTTAAVLTVATSAAATADVAGYSVTHVAGFTGSNGGTETLAISPDGKTAYVAGASSHISVLNLVSRRIVATIVDPASFSSVPADLPAATCRSAARSAATAAPSTWPIGTGR